MSLKLCHDILFEIASHLDPLDCVRDHDILNPSEALRERQETILSLCLASSSFFDVFGPLLRRVVVDNGSSIRRSKLILHYLENPGEAAQVRGLCVCPSTLVSGNIEPELFAQPVFEQYVSEHDLSFPIRALGILLSLLPNLEALKLSVQVHLNVDHQDLLNLFSKAVTSRSLLPKLKSVSLYYANKSQHGFDPRGIERMLCLPNIDEISARGFYTDKTNLLRAGQWAYLPGLRTSNVTVIRLLSCDVDTVFLDRIVRAAKSLKEFTYQWPSECFAEATFNILQFVSSLSEHRRTLKKITFDASLTRCFDGSGQTIMPIGSFSSFERLEHLEMPAILLTGKRQTLTDFRLTADNPRQDEYGMQLRERTTEEFKTAETRRHADSAWQEIDWDALVGLLPDSTTTLVVQCPNLTSDLVGPAKWLQHFALTRLPHLANLHKVDLSSWSPQHLQVLFEVCGFHNVQHLFATHSCTLKLPDDYIFLRD
ncbi:uncharacterized protein PV09_06619 [Verruconis gallopava]|uniref:Leucine-rich repeat domain-containing protein n=1 Tax=Verruconis gallopava TaxID=253628 RepID=A0A0D1XII3_9PEZI|nr:uncharacterized protein PV09_06619 [Verruconis gallopava]KIW02131.1 hypothetical protein PV09_06619 [Verruconis gallopava]